RMADPGENDGQIRKESTSEGQEGYARTEARHAEERKVQEEGNEPKTGDRHRTLRSSPRGRKGAQEESLVQEKNVVWKEDFLEERQRILQLLWGRSVNPGSPCTIRMSIQ